VSTVNEILSQLQEIDSDGACSCDVVVLDLSLADGSLVADNVSRLLARGCNVVIFSIADKQNLVRAALKAGAATVVTKAASLSELADSIRMVANGVYVNNIQTTAAIDSDLEFKDAKLSPREREVLSLYASGMPLKQVAFTLGIANGTAKDYIDRVRTKFADIGRPINNKTEMVLRALEEGLIDSLSGFPEELL